MKGYTIFWNKTFWKFEVDFFHFGNSHFTHTKVQSWVVCISEFTRRNTTCLGDFKLFGDWKVLEDFSKAWGGVWPLFFGQMFFANQFCVGESPLLYFIGGGMPCHQWAHRIWIFVMIHVRFTKKKICVIWFVLFHLFLLGCACCMSIFWLGCHMIS